MKSIAVIAIVTLIIGFLTTVLDHFPFEGVAASPVAPATSTDDFSVEAVEEAANKFSFAYTWVVQDLVSYAKNPDLQRAERQQKALVEYTGSIIPQFQSLVATLQGELDSLVAEANELTETTAQ